MPGRERQDGAAHGAAIAFAITVTIGGASLHKVQGGALDGWVQEGSLRPVATLQCWLLVSTVSETSRITNGRTAITQQKATGIANKYDPRTLDQYSVAKPLWNATMVQHIRNAMIAAM